MNGQVKQVISKWKKLRGGKQLQQVVYKTSLGKIDGKERFMSQTRHEAV